MKKLILTVFVCLMTIGVSAQQDAQTSNRTTVYETFRPAFITLSSGKIIKQKLVNVSMKNGALLYKRGKTNMQANMQQVKAVDFDDRHYVRIDTLLACMVDSVAGNKLYCATLIDIDAYRTRINNERTITNLEIASQVNVTTLDESYNDERMYPLVNYFFYEINGKTIKVHERNINNILTKEKRRLFKSVIYMPDFSWTDKESLMKLLKVIS